MQVHTVTTCYAPCGPRHTDADLRLSAVRVIFFTLRPGPCRFVTSGPVDRTPGKLRWEDVAATRSGVPMGAGGARLLTIDPRVRAAAADRKMEPRDSLGWRRTSFVLAFPPVMKDGARPRAGRRLRRLTRYQASPRLVVTGPTSLVEDPDDVPPAAYSGEWVPGPARGTPEGVADVSLHVALGPSGVPETVIPVRGTEGNMPPRGESP